jgi:serine protease Do
MARGTVWSLVAISTTVLAGIACRRESPPVNTERAPALGESTGQPPVQRRTAALNTAQTAASSNTTGKEMTPRLSVPEAANELTDAFAGAAAAIRGSVVRVDVQIGRGAQGGMARDDRMDPRGFRNPFERFFEFNPFEPQQLPQQPRQGVGSGFVIDHAGHVVTNAHVVERASKVTVRLADDREYPARVAGRDPWTDIAVLVLDKAPEDLTVARIGQAEALRVGQWVLAVGSPLGLEQSVTAGIVSGLGRAGGRMRMSGERVQRYIQTDASINPGNSGGPLVTLAAEVVGVNTLINVGPGGAYGFAIPIEQAAQVAQTLIKEGRMRYPYLGVQVGSVQDLPPEDRQQLGDRAPREGAYVASVVPDAPAARAGLREGDIIVRVGDRPVKAASDVIDAVSGQKIGNKVTVEYWRAGQTRKSEVTIAELDPERGPQAAGGGARLGLGLQTLTEDLARSLGMPADTRGAVVTDVLPGSPAAAAGLAPGDVIVEVDRKPVTSADEVVRMVREGGQKQHLLRVRNRSGSRFVPITPGQ